MKKMKLALTPQQKAIIKKDLDEWLERFTDAALSPEQLYQQAFNLGMKIGSQMTLAYLQTKHSKRAR